MESEAISQPEALHISKVAVGCASIATLARRQQARGAEGIVPVIPRFRPKRADELIGGSVYWIVKHRLAARQTILGFAERDDRRTIIRLAPELVPVRAVPRRPHQGWRYLASADAPADISDEGDGVVQLPADLAAKLSALMLI